MIPVEGLTLGSRYTLTERIAAGGMGEVWKARDARLERVVAIKVMRPSTADEQEFVDRFRDEARHTASLQHPNIATVYDYGEDDGAAFLVMELVDGLPLSQLIARGPFAPDRARSILGQAALALAAAHAQGVVHRDVKPANILVTSEGRVKLTDFGIASAGEGSTHTRTGEVLGTPHYLSPEQATGRAATGSSDLYALGIVGHEMLTGHKPFEGQSAVATALQQVNDPPPPLPDSVPADLRRIIMSLLEKDPARRPASAAALAASLGMPFSGSADPATSVVHTGWTDPSATAVIPPAAAAPGSVGTVGTAILPGAQPPVPPQDRVEEPLTPTSTATRRELRDQEPEKKSRAWLWIIPVVVAIVAIAVLFYQFTSTGTSGNGPSTAFVTGTDTATVTSTSTSTSTSSSPTTVTSTSTSATSTTTSAPPPPTAAEIVVSDYVGKQESDVISALNKLGFTNVKTTPQVDATAPGTVLDVQPRGNVAFNNPVTLTVSSGPGASSTSATTSATAPPATGAAATTSTTSTTTS